MDNPSSTTVSCSTDHIPIEIFELIGAYLSRDDLLRMRLVNHDFERNISRRVFRTVVVPFMPNIYGVTENDTGKSAPAANDTNDKTLVTGRSLQDSSYLSYCGY